MRESGRRPGLARGPGAGASGLRSPRGAPDPCDVGVGDAQRGEELPVGLGRRSLEGGVPAPHGRVVEPGGTQERHPPVLVQPAVPPGQDRLVIVVSTSVRPAASMLE